MSYFKKIQLTDAYGFGVENTPMDEMRVVTPVRLVGANFDGMLDSNFWTPAIANNGTASVTGSEAILAVTVDDNSSSSITTVRKARYIGGSCNRFRAIISLAGSHANNTRRWGMMTVTDGAYFSYTDGVLSAVTMKGTAPTAVASASWNGSTVVPTLTEANSYEIYLTDRRVYFVINGVLVHTAEFLTATWTNTLTLPITIDNVSAGVSSVCSVGIRAATIYRLGAIQTLPMWKYVSASNTAVVLKASAGRLQRIINMDNAAATLTLYDSTTAANTMAVLDLSKVLGSLEFGLDFYNGLTYTVTGSPSFTIVYE
jgi:hypothetical protein